MDRSLFESLEYLAPHASIPPRNGSDRRSWQLYLEMSPVFRRSIFLGREGKSGVPTAWQPYPARGRWRDRKGLTSLVALLSGQDYLAVRHLGHGYRHALAASAGGGGLCVVNFLFSVPALNPRQLAGPLVVETHNDDWEWYQNLARASRAPWVRWLCSGAVRHSARNLASLPVGTLMVHVSSSDAEAYRRRRPDLQHLVIENGTDLRPRRSWPRNDPDRPRVLLFVGSLSSRMNQDGLAHFASHFWPSLRSGTTFRVVGSRPPKALEHWIERQGWELSADVSETDLDRLYEEAHFAVLPFAYGAGSKLKLIEACGRGVPVLTTVAGRVGFPELPTAVLVSDDPGAWNARVSGLDGWIGGNHGVEDLIQFARAFEWRVLADRLLKEVENVFSGKSCLRS